MKKLLLFWFSIISCFVAAQNVTFVYHLKYKPNPEKEVFLSEDYYLDVLGKQSVFRSKTDRKSDSLTEKTGFGLGKNPVFSNQIYVQKNLAKMDIVRSFTTQYNDHYFIRIHESLEWKILPEKAKIGDIDCQKATLKYGGRNWTAWFTQSIPLQEGPYIFHGLPGLIIKISDEQSDYDFSLTMTKNSNKNNMFYLRKGKEINWGTFQTMQLNHYSDPYAELKTRNIKYQVADSNGNLISMDLKALTKTLQKNIKENNNPIELDKAVKFP